jgi:hypothetical protein
MMQHGSALKLIQPLHYATENVSIQYGTPLTLQFSDGKMKPMDRKPQQQTLSIRISDSLREFLERSKKVIAAGRTDFVSTSDVAKILLESAKDDGLDSRLEVAELGGDPKEMGSRAASHPRRVDFHGAVHSNCVRGTDGKSAGAWGGVIRCPIAIAAGGPRASNGSRSGFGSLLSRQLGRWRDVE